MRSKHFSPLLRELHWLRVPDRIRFPRCVLAFRCLHGTLSTVVVASARPTHLHTVSLVVTSTRRTPLGDRAVAAARASSDLPPTITTSPSLLAFRWQPKLCSFNLYTNTTLPYWRMSLDRRHIRTVNCKNVVTREDRRLLLHSQAGERSIVISRSVCHHRIFVYLEVVKRNSYKQKHKKKRNITMVNDYSSSIQVSCIGWWMTLA